MNEQIGGFIGDLIPFGIFLYIALILFGVIKLKNKPKSLENPPVYYKIIVIVALVCFATLIVMRIVGK